MKLVINEVNQFPLRAYSRDYVAGTSPMGTIRLEFMPGESFDMVRTAMTEIKPLVGSYIENDAGETTNLEKYELGSLAFQEFTGNGNTSVLTAVLNELIDTESQDLSYGLPEPTGVPELPPAEDDIFAPPTDQVQNDEMSE